MFKFLTAVLFLFGLNNSYAEISIDQLHTQQLIRAKLWKDGLVFNNTKTDTYASKDKLRQLPEELSVALDMLEDDLVGQR